MIEQTVEELAPLVGTRPACRAVGASVASVYRRRRPPEPRPRKPRPAPSRALSEAEREAVLEHLHSPRFVDCAPAQVYARLLDEGRYLCSERTMYRLLEARHGGVRERRDQLTHPAYVKPELLAGRPNELWSWDISKLKGPAKWTGLPPVCPSNRGKTTAGCWGALVSVLPSVVGEHQERLTRLDDVGGELCRVAVADVFHRVDPLGRNHQRLAGGVGLCSHAVDRVFQLALQDVDDLFTRMPVSKRPDFLANLDAVLDDHATGGAEVVLLQIGSLDSGRLLNSAPQCLLSGAAHLNLRWLCGRWVW